MISLKNVTKNFYNTVAVDDVSFDIGSSEIVGFLGPNGAGKTTTMRMIAGYLTPDQGSIMVDGLDVSVDPVATKSRIGYLPENNPLYHDLLVSESLDLVADLRRIPKNERSELIDKAVEETGLASVFYKPVGELSKGFKQRTGLALAILHEPKILILDEPTEGLDPNQRIEVRKLIRNLGKDRTVVVSTHVLPEIKNICDRVIIINDGAIAADGNINELVAGAKSGTHVHTEIEGTGVGAKLKSLSGVSSVDTARSGKRVRAVIRVEDDAEIRPAISALARENDWTIWELYVKGSTLEDVFRELTLTEGTQ